MGFHLQGSVVSALFKVMGCLKPFQPLQCRAASAEAKAGLLQVAALGAVRVVGTCSSSSGVLLGAALEAGTHWGELLLCRR